MDSEVGFRIVTVAPSSYWGGKAWLFMSANPVVTDKTKTLWTRIPGCLLSNVMRQIGLYLKSYVVWPVSFLSGGLCKLCLGVQHSHRDEKKCWHQS